jgi:exosortase
MTAIPAPHSPTLPRFALAIAAAVAIGVLPLYAAELNVLLNQSMYQFFPLVYGFAAYVGWSRWEEAAGTVGRRANARWWPEFACLAMAFACLAVHAGLFGPWLGGAAGLAAIAAGIFALGRLRNCQLWDLWWLLVISSRLPLNLNTKLANGLQFLSSELSSVALDAFGIVHYLAGNVVQLPQGDLFVAEACSGVVSVMSVVACSAVLAIWLDRPWLRSWMLVAVGVVYAMLMNSCRIVIIAAARSLFDIDLSHGWVHQVLGILVFLVTCLCLLSTDYLLASSCEWLASGRSAMAARARAWLDYRLYPSPPLASTLAAGATSSAPSRWVFLATAGLALMLGSYHAFALYTSYLQNAGLSVGVVALAKDMESDGIAAAVAPWTIVAEEIGERRTLAELAPYSKLYTLKHPTQEVEVTLSVDFPFYRKWHDVTYCYQRFGWKMLDKQIHRGTAPADLEGCEYISGDFFNQDKGYGHLVFCNINEDGKLIEIPPEWGDFGYVVNQIIHRFQQPRQVSLNPNKIFQVQVFCNEPESFSDEMKQELEQLFFRSFREVRSFLIRSREELSR